MTYVACWTMPVMNALSTNKPPSAHIVISFYAQPVDRVTRQISRHLSRTLISKLQQKAKSVRVQWCDVNNRISALISQSDIFCVSSKKKLKQLQTLDYIESTREHVTCCSEKLEEVENVIKILSSDVTDMDLSALDIAGGQSAIAPLVSTCGITTRWSAMYYFPPSYMW